MLTIKISRTGKEEELKKVIEDLKKKHKEIFEKYLLELSYTFRLKVELKTLKLELNNTTLALEEERRAHNVMTTEAFNNIFYRIEEELKVEELKATMNELLSTLLDEDKCNCIKISICKEKIKEVLANDDLC